MKLKSITLLFAVAVLALGSAQAEVKSGEAAPAFTLTDTNGMSHNLSDFKGKYVVLEWFNHGCPFVVKHYSSGNMQRLQKDWTKKGVVWLSINSAGKGSGTYESPEKSNKTAKKKGAKPTAILLDYKGTVGRAYGARTTPHIYIINPEGTLIYQGAIDSIASANAGDVERADNYVDMVLMASKSGEPVPVSNTRPYGCSVKYPN